MPAFTAMARAVSCFRLAIPTMRESTTVGRMVICQIRMNASPMGARAAVSSPKTSPVRTPRARPSSIQTVRLRWGGFMLASRLPAERGTERTVAAAAPGQATVTAGAPRIGIRRPLRAGPSQYASILFVMT